jgi:hypothetical protein
MASTFAIFKSNMTQLLNLVAKTFKYEKLHRLKWQRIRKNGKNHYPLLKAHQNIKVIERLWSSGYDIGFPSL